MRPSAVRRIAIVVGAAWALVASTMLLRGDPGATDVAAQLLVVAVTVGGLAWLVHRFRVLPRRASFEVQAKGSGLRAQPGDPLGLLRSAFALFHRAASARDLENTAWGRSGGRDVVVADYWYSPSSDTTREDHRRFVCVIDQDRPGWPDLSVAPTSAASIVRDAVGLHDVELESERFNRAFDVRAADRRFATTLLDGRMMEWLLEQAPGTGFEIVASRTMLFVPRHTTSLDDVSRALRRFDDFLEHVPTVIPSLFPERLVGPSVAPVRTDRRPGPAT